MMLLTSYFVGFTDSLRLYGELVKAFGMLSTNMEGNCVEQQPEDLANIDGDFMVCSQAQYLCSRLSNDSTTHPKHLQSSSHLGHDPIGQPGCGDTKRVTAKRIAG